MKKLLILTLFLTITLLTFSQTENKLCDSLYDIPEISKNLSSGDYLIRSRNELLSGIGLTAIGLEMIHYGNKLKIENNGKTNPLISLGIATAIIGFGLEIDGIINIGNAGIVLNENGIVLSIPIK